MTGDTVQQVKEKLSIQEVVSAHVKINRAGKSLVGLCPFHKEKTPSFHVSIDRGTFHCFGCGQGGDMFTFTEKIEGVDFKGALKILAERAGVAVEYTPESRARAGKMERMRDIMQKATDFFVNTLEPNSSAYAYAVGRGLTNETIQSWNIGYAPEGWRTLLDAFSLEGYTTAELASVGLIKEADGKSGTWYDRFRDRLIFPLRDSAGRVVAFTGRALSKDEHAKYLNSPETDLFHKSEVLFGMDKAKDSIRTRGFALLMEGQMDVIHAHQAGFTNAIALSGTALSNTQLALIKRYAENIMLAFDSDGAGLSATLKSAQSAISCGLRVKAVPLPEGKDPADLITRDGSKAFAKRIQEASPIIEFFLAELAKREKDPHRLVRHIENVVLPLIRSMGSPMEREHFLGVTARTLGLSIESVRESLGKVKDQVINNAQQTPSTAMYANGNPDPVLARGNLLLATIHAYPDSPLAKRVESEYSRIIEAPPPSGVILSDADLFQAEQMFGENPTENMADELLYAFEEAVIRKAHQESVYALRVAEAGNDNEAIKEAEAVCARLSTRLAGLGS